ncbi:MAG: dihydrolipoamide acetyltransferase [Pirellulaceae bacterium]
MADKEQPVETPKPSMLPKLLISGFIGTIVIAETFIFFFMVPSADDVAALAEARLVSKLENKMENDGEEVLEKTGDKEFSLGDYGVVFTPPGTDRNHSIEFSLFGMVKEKDEKRLEELFEERQGRFRDRILNEIRIATLDELQESNLGLLRRRILATSNEILEEPIILSIGIPNYQLREE